MAPYRPLTTSPASRRTVPEVVQAPAKLTRSLRVTGVRADGYHLIDAEMVSLDLADTLTFGDGDGLVVRGLGAEVPTGETTWSCERWMPSGAPRTSRSTSASRPERASAGVQPTRPRCCGGLASTTSSWPCASAPTCRSAWSGAAPASPGSAR